MLKNKRGQSTVEYAIVVGVVVAALVAMQTYVKRGMQARYHDGVNFLADQTANGDGTVNSGMGKAYTAVQYEPYYLESQYNTNSDKTSSETNGARGQVNRTLTKDDRSRDSGGYEKTKDLTGKD